MTRAPLTFEKMASKIVKRLGLVLGWIVSRRERGTTGSVNTKFRLLGPDDKIVVDGFDGTL